MYYWHLYLDINGSDIPCTRHMVPHSAVLLVITSDRDLMICFNYHINSERRDLEHKQETTLNLQMEPIKAYKSSHPMNIRLL